MKFGLKTAAAALVLAGLSGVAFAQADVIKQRKEHMEAIGKSVGGVLVKMVKGEEKYDSAKAKAALDTIAKNAQGFDTLFPKGSETGEKTEAAPKIWEDPAGFKAALAKLQDTVAAQSANATKDLDGLKTAVTAIGGACKNCHDSYRVKKS